MATTFPSALDVFTNPLPTNVLSGPPHSGQHSNANDAIEAIEAILVGPAYVNLKGLGGDDTGVVACNTILNTALATYRRVFIGDGTWLIDDEILPPSNTEIWISPNATITAKDQAWADQGMITIDGVTNVQVRGGTLNGNKGAAGGSDNRVIGVKIINSAARVRITGVRCINMPGADLTGVNGGDGFYIGGTGATVPSDVWLTDCVTDSCVRTGLAIVAGNRIRVRGGSFLNTSGSATGAGVDIEPNASTDTCEDIAFEDCTASGNQYGFAVQNGALAGLRNIRFVSCVARDNRVDGWQVTQQVMPLGFTDCNSYSNDRDGLRCTSDDVHGFSWKGGAIYDNTEEGVNLDRTRRFRLESVDIYRNGKNGVLVGFVSGGVLRSEITGCAIYNNSATTAGVYDGINFSGNVTHPNFRTIIEDNWIGNSTNYSTLASQRNGINISSNASGQILRDNTYEGLTSNIGGAGAIANQYGLVEHTDQRLQIMLVDSAPNSSSILPGCMIMYRDDATTMIRAAWRKSDGTTVTSTFS